MGICPKCKEEIEFVVMERTALHEEGSFKDTPCLMYLCPDCKSVVGVQINPLYQIEGKLKEHLKNML